MIEITSFFLKKLIVILSEYLVLKQIMEQSIKQLLFPKFCIVIINYLTNETLLQIGEHCLTIGESNNFINDNLVLINECIQDMIEDYDAEDHIEQLYNVELEWIQDYLAGGDLYENMKNMRF